MLFIYIAISIITVITLTLFFALSPVNTITSSRLTASPLSEERLIESVREFAKTSVQAGLERGNGVSLAHAKKQIYRAQTIISTKSRSKSSLLPCEEAYLDNFYKVLELIDVANEGVNDLKKLPHHDGVPVVF